MTRRRIAWRVDLSSSAERDYENILRWTVENFGDAQAVIYDETIRSALKALLDGPKVLGAKAMPELGTGAYRLHVSRGGRTGRHYLIFRATPAIAHGSIEILRILHEAIDLSRHVKRRQIDS
jgi:toxin ParE1/3/4